MNKNIKIEYVDINKLKPAEYNPRKADKKQVAQLKKSLKQFGFIDPVIVNNAENRFNIVIGGHFRLSVAKEMGIKQAPVVYVNIPDINKERELNLRLNKNVGSWDYSELANFDIELLKEVGFEEMEFDGFDILKEIEGDKEKGKNLPQLFEVIVECKNEKEQEKIYNKLIKEGLKCRVLIL